MFVTKNVVLPFACFNKSLVDEYGQMKKSD